MPSKSSEKKKPSSDKQEKKRSERSAAVARPPGPVMGLDLSLRGCGVSVLSRKGKVRHLDVLRTGPIAAKADGLKLAPRGLLASGTFLGSDEERIAFLVKRLRKVWLSEECCFVVVENHAFGAKGRGKTQLAELHGVVKHYLNKDEIAFAFVAPGTLKKHATGDGRAQKIDMIYAAKKTGLDVSDSDRADALWCGDYGVKLYGDLVESDSDPE